MWMSLVLAGLSIRAELAGVSSFVRGLGLKPQAYRRLLHLFHTLGLDLAKLTGTVDRAGAEVVHAATV
jgi:hypothetical protein